MKRIFVFLSFLFFVQSVLADYITQNITNACDMNKQFFTHFTINSYTCNAGEYLPAHSLGCSECPSGYTCNGGTYDFNDTEFQGAEKSSPLITQSLNNLCAANSPKEFFTKFSPNTHTCNPGYYLPANVDECRPCLLNHYCVGGTYTFNETTDQGITACAAGTFAPTGNAFCYEHILHVGNEYLYLRSSKRTTPSLNVGMNNDVFYANMTTTPTYMTSGSTHYFKTIYNEQIYYICDDTIYDK